MKKLACVFVIIVGVFAVSMRSNPAAAQPQKPMDRAALVKRAAFLAASGWQKSVWGQGSCQTGDSNPSKRTAWAALLGCENATSGAAVRWIRAGFHLPALGSAGSIPNARVAATFTVSQVVGQAWLEVGVVPGVLGSGPPRTRRAVSEPGTFTVQSNPIVLESDRAYEAGAWLEVNDQCGAMCGVVGQVTELKWVF